MSRDVIFHNNISSKFQAEIENDEISPAANSDENIQDDSIASDETEQNEDESSVREDSDEMASSTANEIDLNGTVVTLGNNTANNDDFEDAVDDATSSTPE